MTEPTLQITHPSGIEIRYFAENKAEKVKRYYEMRSSRTRYGNREEAWQEVISVTTAQKILHKEALISWAQRMGGIGAVKLYNMQALVPVQQSGHIVTGSHFKDRGLVVVGEDEIVELLKSHGLDTNSLKKAGGDRGQSCHDALEMWSKTGQMPNPATYPLHEQGYVQALVNFLTESGAESVRHEVVVGSLEDEWAGRFDNDLLLPKSVQLQTHWTPAGRGDQRTWFEAGLYRVDLKTAKDVFEENGEQLEAYEKGAIECGLPETLQRVVIHTSPESRYKFVPVGSGTPTIKQFAWSTYEDFKTTLVKFKAMEARKLRKKEVRECQHSSTQPAHS
jgi:hypothetical protein